LHRMIELGADLTIQNYYGDTIMDQYQMVTDKYPRKNNTNFKNVVFKTYP